MAVGPGTRPRNLLLRALADEDFARIAPHFEAVELRLRQSLIRPGDRLTHVFFLDDGLVSIVATTATGLQSEVGMVGYEGMVDVGAINAAGTTPLECFIQIPGRAHSLPVEALTAALDASPRLRALLRSYAQSFLIQVAHTALANALHTIEQRLSRWLLMSLDRVGGREILMTHEFLSIMLGVRRAGVTMALQQIERRRLIEARRGSITVVDRAGLVRLAGESYGTPEVEYSRLMGVDFRKRPPLPVATSAARL